MGLLLNKENKMQVDSESQGIQLRQMHEDSVIHFLQLAEIYWKIIRIEMEILSLFTFPQGTAYLSNFREVPNFGSYAALIRDH